MQICFGCRSTIPRNPNAPLCAACKRDPSRRLVKLNQALALGHPLSALRSIGASLSTSTATFFLESRLLSAARRDPGLFAPEAARRDLAQLRRDRRAARQAHDATRAALLRDASRRPWREGAHVEAVARGLLSQQQAMGLARAARDAWAFLSRPDVRKSRACARREVLDALNACVIARLGPRLLHAGSLRGALLPPLDVSPRAVSVEVVNRVLRGISDGAPRVGLLWGARCVPWTTRDHPFVCDSATRQVVREVLMHLCRRLGVYSGSEVAKRVFALVFTLTSTEPVEDGGRRPEPPVGDESALELHPASVGPSSCVVLAPPRVRFGFLLQPGDAHEGRTCAK
jgi:hypothetical protein